MVAAIRQTVRVRRGGVIQLRSTQLKPGSRAEVIVLLPEPSELPSRRSTRTNGAPASAPVPLARMTKQVRGDIAAANRLRNNPKEKPIPYDIVRKRLGMA